MVKSFFVAIDVSMKRAEKTLSFYSVNVHRGLQTNQSEMQLYEKWYEFAFKIKKKTEVYVTQKTTYQKGINFWLFIRSM